uniref:Ig-like domain-containing protein n=1 Tax=Prolemur simus TaxID=1328070 RepID=A0A8C8YMC2_PROSS
MGSSLLFWVALCLLGTDHTGAGVSQSPRHKVTERGQNVTLRCDPISGHISLFWYRQTLEKGLALLIYFQGGEATDKSGLPHDQFSAERPEGSFSTLKIHPAEQGDSAVYLCASSSATVWHSHLLPAHKPPPSRSLQLPETLKRGLSCSSLPKGKKEIWTSAVLWVERDHRFTPGTRWL